MTHLSRVNLFLIRLLGLACCCFASFAYADSRCGDLDARTAKFVETIQKHASKTASGGQFRVKPVDAGSGRKKFEISYMVAGGEKFHVSVTPSVKNGEDFSFDPFRSRDGGALLVTVGFGGSDGFGCGYLIHARAARFRFEKLEGVFNATDVNRDGLDEFVIHERQNWGESDRCDTRTSWRRIYRLDANGDKLVDASKEFASYYTDLAKVYQKEKSEYERYANPIKKECQQQFEAIIKRANTLAGSAVPSLAATGKPSTAMAGALAAPASAPTDKQTSFDQQWFGKWQGSEKSSTLEISANTIRYKHLAGDEGVYQPVMTPCKWSPTKDALRDMQTGDCRFSYSQAIRSKEEIAPAFEKMAREYCRNNATVGFRPDGKPIACGSKGDTMTAFNDSRKALATMKPGLHNFLLLNDSGDVSELILDGENILGIHYRGDIQFIELFTRVVSSKQK